MKGKGINYRLALLIVTASIISACEKDEPIKEVPIDFDNISSFIIDRSGAKILSANNTIYSFQNALWLGLIPDSELNFSKINDLAIELGVQNDTIWIATDKGLLNLSSLETISTSNSGILNNNVSHIYFDKNSGMYCATPDGVSTFINGQWLDTTGIADMFIDFSITDIAVASNDYAYVTTYGGGVGRFKVEVDGISGATYFDTDWTRLKSNNINTVFIDDTIQWYGTDKGVAVHRSEYTKWDWETYTTFDGLISDTVIAIVKDHSDNMWFGTRKGLSRFDGSTWTNYNREKDGIISDTIEYLAIDIDGSLWIASLVGLTQFKENEWINIYK